MLMGSRRVYAASVIAQKVQVILPPDHLSTDGLLTTRLWQVLGSVLTIETTTDSSLIQVAEGPECS